jgi:hypothetical protein
MKFTVASVVLSLVVLSLSLFTGETFAKPTQEGGCPKGKSAILPDPDNCAVYIKCENGKASAKACPPGLLFNRNLLKCVKAQDANCNI